MNFYSIAEKVLGTIALFSTAFGCASTEPLKSIEPKPEQVRRTNPQLERAKSIINQYGKEGQMNKDQYCVYILDQFFIRNGEDQRKTNRAAALLNMQLYGKCSNGDMTNVEAIFEDKEALEAEDLARKLK
jgi:hypothetical protein